MINIKLTIEHNHLKTHDYQHLRKTTKWATLPDSTVKKALQKDLFSIAVYSNKQIVGMGRVIGDGAIYFYIQDVIVHPEFKNQGIGKLVLS